MIELTRLNGRPMVDNSDLIKTAEASPDTMLTLINGEKLIVREEIAEVVEKILVYRARLLAVVARRLHHFGDLERAAALHDATEEEARFAKDCVDAIDIQIVLQWSKDGNVVDHGHRRSGCDHRKDSREQHVLCPPSVRRHEMPTRNRSQGQQK